MKRAFPLLLLLTAGCFNSEDGVLRVAGLLEGIDVKAGTLVGGRVVNVHVAEGDRVDQDALLLDLDPKDTAPMVAAAAARLSQAEAVLAKLEAGARPEQIQPAEAGAEQARLQYRSPIHI